MQDHRDGGVGVLVGVRALAGGLGRARRAGRHRGHELQVRWVGLQAHDDRLAAGQRVGALRAVVVLDVAGAALGQGGDRLERRGALELGEDRVIGPAQVVGQDVEAAAVGHADHDLAGAAGRRQLDELVEHRHGHVQALDRELLLAQVGLVHEALEGVDLGQPLEQRLLLVVGERTAELSGLDRLAQPQALAMRGDVLDLVGDRAAVGLAQMGQGVGQRGAGHVHAQDVGRDLGHDLGGEPQRRGVERGVALGLAPERIQPRGEVAVGAVGLEQRGGRLHGHHQLLVVAGAGRGARRRLRRGARGGGGRGGGRRRRELGQLDPEVREDVLVEGLVALQQRLDALEEAAGLGALDDPVVVGGGHRHDLLGADHRADPLQPDRIGDRAGGHDRALAHHQTRHRGDRADPAGVGERDVAAGEVVGGERVGPRLLDQRVVGVQELGEAHASRVADDRHHQRAGAVLLLHVDGQAEVDGAVVVAVGLAVDLLEVVGHHRHVVGGDLGDGVGDQVGEGDPLAPVLELLAPLVERGHGQRAERGGRRDRAALVHVAGQRGAAALDELSPGRRRRGGGGWGAVATVEHIGLGDTAAPGGTLDRREVDALSGRDAAGHR